MDRDRVGEQQDPLGEARSAQQNAAQRGLAFAGRAAAALAALLTLGLVGAAGCGDTLDGRGQDETSDQAELVGEARQADSTPITCVTLQRGRSKTFDAMISGEKVANNYGSSTTALVGLASGGVDHFHSLFKFDVSAIPVNATITSATIALNQLAAAPGTWNAHLVTAPWAEATVTWQSFAGAFNPVAFKSPGTATASVVFSIAPQLQAWVSGASPNHGLLIARPGASQSKIKTAEWPVPNAWPLVTACYKVSCAAHFADCNGVAADGCEADLQGPAHCGACGNACSAPHATAACASGACAVGSCDLGWADCDGDPANGCETDLTTTSDCGACGVPCALPNAVTTCAGGSCKATSCLAGAFECDGDPDDGCELIPCADGSHCAENADCTSGVCVGGFCAAPACVDHTHNGGETDVDCGGPCAPCASGAGCLAAADCASGVCQAGTCAAPGCADGVKNGDETGVDCGGACAVAEVCNGIDDDCDGAVDNGAAASCPSGANASATCTAGSCGLTCTAGFGNCDGNPATGCEVNLQTSDTSCGVCGKVCAVGSHCGGGTCNAGNLLVTGESSNAVLAFNGKTGAFAGTFASAGLNGPDGLSFGPDGNLYVASYASSQIIKFNGTTGASMGVFVNAGVGGLSTPIGILFGADGNLYVGNRGTASILRYNGATGAFLGTFASGGGLNGPDCFAFGPNGDLYVSSRFSNQLMVYNGTTGAFKSVLVNGGGLSTPEGIAFDAGGNLLVVSRGTSTIRKYNAVTGAFLATWASGGGLSNPFGILMASDGNAYVTNVGDNSILKFDGATGASLGVFVSAGSGGLSIPTAIIQRP